MAEPDGLLERAQQQARKQASLLATPAFEKDEAGNDRDAADRDIAAAVTTYRYLRLGMVMIVVALGASLVLRVRTVDCWQGSVSAYYYTPARAVFVSGMVAIGVSLIVIKGSTVAEDLLLNLAGVLAPIVAFVPTSFEAACVAGQPLEHGHGGQLPAAILSDVNNNIKALLIAGTVAVLVALVVFLGGVWRARLDLGSRHNRSRLVLLGASVVMVVIGWWLWASEIILDMHGWSAVIMFVFLGLASVWNGLWLFYLNRGNRPTTSPHWMAYAVSYLVVGLTMGIAGAIIMFVPADGWDHRTLVLEMVEVGLFMALWLVQSVERWGKVMQAPGPPPSLEAGAQPAG